MMAQSFARAGRIATIPSAVDVFRPCHHYTTDRRGAFGQGLARGQTGARRQALLRNVVQNGEFSYRYVARPLAQNFRISG